jgi:translation elongation factor EF-G
MDVYDKGAVIGGLNARRGTIIDSEVREDEFTAVAEVALNDMFGYSSQLRGATQGKGEFSMEYKVPSTSAFSLENLFFDVGRRNTCRCCQMCKLSCRKHIVTLCSIKSRYRLD